MSKKLHKLISYKYNLIYRYITNTVLSKIPSMILEVGLPLLLLKQLIENKWIIRDGWLKYVLINVIVIWIHPYLINTSNKQININIPHVKGKIHRRSFLPWNLVPVPAECKFVHINLQLAFCMVIAS